MSVFSKLLGSDTVVEKTVNGIYNGLDNMVYSDEEKKENHKAFLELYEPFKVAQRYLAMTFSIPFAVLHIGAFSLRMAFWDNEPLQASIKVIQVDMNNTLGMIVLTIVGFYFAGGVIEGGVKAFNRVSK
jgi:hypothetical protein